MKLLIGSRALHFRNSKLLMREPKDIDYIVTPEQFSQVTKAMTLENAMVIHDENNTVAYKTNTGIILEYTIIEPGSSDELLRELVLKDPQSTVYRGLLIPSLDVLFTIKSSHRYKKFKDVQKFYKTFQDWHTLNLAGCKIPDMYKEFYRLRQKESYTYSHPKLNVTKNEFFKDDEIKYVYDHDWIHEVVALGNRPAYQEYLVDEVECSKDKFFSLDLDTRLRGVIEESCVLAIERALVPHGVMTPHQSFLYAYAKVASTITSGWFRKFAYDNGLEVLKRYPEGYWEKFQEAAKEAPVFHGKV